MRRLGFIFIAYRVNFWWWEGVEMLRKFLMTWYVPSCFFAHALFVCRHCPQFGLPVAACSNLIDVLVHARFVERLRASVGLELIDFHSHLTSANTHARQLPGVYAGGGARAACNRGTHHLHLPAAQPDLSPVLHGRTEQPADIQLDIAVSNALLWHPHWIYGEHGRHRIRRL